MDNINNIHNTGDESKSLPSFNQISNFVEGTGYSTLILKTSLPIDNQINKNLSAIHQNSLTDSNTSVSTFESCTSSSTTEIMEFIRDDQHKISNIESSIPKKNILFNADKQVIENSDKIIKNEQESYTHIANLSKEC